MTAEARVAGGGRGLPKLGVQLLAGPITRIVVSWCLNLGSCFVSNQKRFSMTLAY